MKRALFYTLANAYIIMEVMAVTSQKGRILYGRDEHDNPTHRLEDSCYGRFPTAELAYTCKSAVRDNAVRYQLKRKPLQAEITFLHMAEKDERDKIIAAAIDIGKEPVT